MGKSKRKQHRKNCKCQYCKPPQNGCSSGCFNLVILLGVVLVSNCCLISLVGGLF